jgi:hypothetical protein
LCPFGVGQVQTSITRKPSGWERQGLSPAARRVHLRG